MRMYKHETWMNQLTKLSSKSHTQKSAYSMIPLI